MAPHSSTLAWKIPWTEETGRLQSMGWRRVIHDCMTSLPLFTFMHWRRKWQPTPVFLLGESQGRGEPGGLPSMGLHRVGHDWSDLAAAARYQPRIQTPTPPQTLSMEASLLTINSHSNSNISDGLWRKLIFNIGKPNSLPHCSKEYWYYTWTSKRYN